MPKKLDFPLFDADNHLYEPEDAFTRHLPDKYRNVVDYVEVRGRKKIVVQGVISEYIPNPTFEVVARPGAQEEYFRIGNPEGKTYREIMGDPMKCIPAFREPGPRLELMDELHLDRTLMFPTLASLLEERITDPEVIHTIIHAFNEWMYETWTFNYADRIFSTPVITLPIVERAIEELEWVVERGAKAILIRPAAVPGYKGSRSPGLPEFDPFWAKCVEHDVVVGMHASDTGYAGYLNIWENSREFLPFRPTAFRMVVQGKRPIEDAMAAMVCHGALSRHPGLKLAVIENGSEWVPHLLHQMADVYRKMPQEFLEDPVVAFKRNVYVSPFHEDNIANLIDTIGADHILFGSDYPHPEGLAEPTSYIDHLPPMDEGDIAKIMGGNLGGLMGITAPV